MADALHSVLVTAGVSLARLKSVDTPQRAVEFFQQLGYDLPHGAFGGLVSAVASQFGGLADATLQLANASSDAAAAAAIANLFEKLTGAIKLIEQLHSELKSGPGGALPNFDDMPRRLTDFLVLDFLDANKTDFHQTLHALGLIDHDLAPPAGAPQRRINWERFGQILTDPAQIASDVYRWDSDFDAAKFLTRFDALMRASFLPGGVYPQSAATLAALGSTEAVDELRFPVFQRGLTPSTYAQFGVTLSPVEAQGGKKKGLALLPYIMGSSTFDFSVCDRGELTFDASSDINGAGLILRPPIEAEGILNFKDAFRASLRVREKPDKSQELILVGSTGGSRISLQNLGVRWFAESGQGKPDVGVQAEIQNFRLVIDAGNGDGFIQKVLSGIHVQAELGVERRRLVAIGRHLRSWFKAPN